MENKTEITNIGFEENGMLFIELTHIFDGKEMITKFSNLPLDIEEGNYVIKLAGDIKETRDLTLTFSSFANSKNPIKCDIHEVKNSKKMTLEEIEEKLGHKIEIVSEKQ